MIFKIDNRTIEANDAYFREFGFGKDPVSHTSHQYTFTVTSDEFIDSFSGYYREYANDDMTYEDAADKLDLELRKYGWPKLSRLLKEHPDLLTKFLLSNSYDVVQAAFSKADLSTDHRFAINSVESILIEQEVLSFSGKAIELR